MVRWRFQISNLGQILILNFINDPPKNMCGQRNPLVDDVILAGVGPEEDIKALKDRASKLDLPINLDR